MARLTVDAINPQLVERMPPVLWRFGLVAVDLTCGFCRTSFRAVIWVGREVATCQACGTRNLLERRRGLSEPLE
ncbi:MAG TPA: hypothetical protein VK867_06595 [Candidatus Limnocylindrales bacterium]|nr:hypothetical protein [Candidatus Limnocylindrales bacterium]